MEKPNKKKTLSGREKHKNFELKYRSEIISKAIEVEHWVTTLICLNFSNQDTFDMDSYLKFYYIFMEDGKMLSFDNKREILRRIVLVEKLMPEKDRGLLDEGIQKTSAIRNRVAHKKVDSSMIGFKEFKGTEIKFESYKFEKGKIVENHFLLDEQRFNDELNNMDHVISKLRLLEKIILKK